MAHEVTIEDNLVMARTPAWHGLGTVVPEALTVQGSLQVAGLDWEVSREALTVKGGRFDGLEAPDIRALVRGDTGRVLGYGSGDYTVLQNREVADLIDALADEGAIPKCESAGSVRQGRNVWFLVQTGTFAVGLGDEVKQYTLFTTSHDGSGAFRIIPTSIRVQCANTLNAAEGGKGTASVAHTKNMKARLEALRKGLKAAQAAGVKLETGIRRLASTKMSQDDVRAFFLKVYTSAVGPIPSTVETPADERKRRAAVELVSQWVANLDSPTFAGAGVNGTAWHALNAVTLWADHSRGVRVTSTVDSSSDARAYSNVLGTSARLKGKALELAMAAAG